MSFRIACACLVLLASCSSAGMPGAQTTLDQTDKAYQIQAESDLRNAAVAEDAYFAQNGAYTTDLAGTGFNSSGGLSVTVPQADATGFCVQAVDSDSGSSWHFRKAEGAVRPGPC